MGNLSKNKFIFFCYFILLCVSSIYSVCDTLVFHDCFMEKSGVTCQISIKNQDNDIIGRKFEQIYSAISSKNISIEVGYHKDNIYFKTNNINSFRVDLPCIGNDHINSNVDNYDNNTVIVTFNYYFNNFKVFILSNISNINFIAVIAIIYFTITYKLFHIIIYGILFFKILAVEGIRQDTCTTVGMGVSNITDCIDDTCSSLFATSGTSLLDMNYKTCLVIREINDTVTNSTFIPAHNISIHVLDASYNVPLVFKKMDAEIYVTWNAYCKREFPSAQTDCTNAKLNGNFSIEFCEIVRLFQKDSIFDGDRNVAVRVGIIAKPRYAHYKVQGEILNEIALGFEYDNASDIKEWNGVTPLDFNLNDGQVKLNVFNAKFDTAPILASNLIFDTWVPYDIYEIDNINSVGEHKVGLYGAIHWDAAGKLRYNMNALRNMFTYKMIKCQEENTRVHLDFDYADTDVNLENQRKAGNGLRTRNPGLLFYNEGSFRQNDQWATNTQFSHVHQVAKPQSDYNKQGPTIGFGGFTVRTYAGLALHMAVNIDNVCMYAIDDSEYTNAEAIIRVQSPEGPSINLVCSTLDGNWWFGVGGSFTPWSNTTISHHFYDMKGLNFTVNWSVRNLTTSFFDDNVHLHYQYKDVGSFQYVVKAEYPATFFVHTVCPEISNIIDDPVTKTISFSAKSACGSGSVIITTSDNQVIHSKSIYLTQSSTLFVIPRIADKSGLFTIGLCSKICTYKNVKISKFPIVQTEDETEATDDSLGQQENHFKPTSSNWWHFGDLFSGFGKLDLQHKIYAVLYGIAYVAISILLFFLFLWLFMHLLAFLFRKKVSPERRLYNPKSWYKPYLPTMDELVRQNKKTT